MYAQNSNTNIPIGNINHKYQGLLSKKSRIDLGAPPLCTIHWYTLLNMASSAMPLSSHRKTSHMKTAAKNPDFWRKLDL